ncbi:MAG: nucleotide exchange factor GrpE [Dehalococcoidia bacterium]|nr:nucleotide exchange factor GrpE [Dehalococcoidia bacterium]
MTEERISPVAPDAASIGDDAAPAAEQIAALRAELDQARQQQLRALADYQNLQRRAQEERTEFGRYQLTALVVNFLPVLDDLELAIESVHDGIRDDRWVDGVRLVLQKFRGVLEAAGVEEIRALSQPFSPDRHEAIGAAPGPAGDVVRVMRRGYTLGGRVLRPAMVMVGDGEVAVSADAL